MKSSQENKLSMYYAVQQVCNLNQKVWESVPAFRNSLMEFVGNVGKLGGVIRKQQEGSVGITLGKEQAEQKLFGTMFPIANALFACADDKHNAQLKNKVDKSRSEVKRMRDTEFLEYCKMVNEDASLLKDVLKDYGVETQDLKDLENMIGEYTAVIASPRAAVAERKTATEEMAALILLTDKLLNDKMDKLAENFKLSDPDFYSQYFNARKIVHSGVRHEKVTAGENDTEAEQIL